MWSNVNLNKRACVYRDKNIINLFCNSDKIKIINKLFIKDQFTFMPYVFPGKFCQQKLASLDRFFYLKFGTKSILLLFLSRWMILFAYIRLL